MPLMPPKSHKLSKFSQPNYIWGDKIIFGTKAVIFFLLSKGRDAYFTLRDVNPLEYRIKLKKGRREKKFNSLSQFIWIKLDKESALVKNPTYGRPLTLGPEMKKREQCLCKTWVAGVNICKIASQFLQNNYAVSNSRGIEMW